MGKILNWGCTVKPRGVPKIWPISETGRANILNDIGYICFRNWLNFGTPLGFALQPHVKVCSLTPILCLTF